MANFAKNGEKEAKLCSYINNNVTQLSGGLCSVRQIEIDSVNNTFFLYFYLIFGTFIVGFFISVAFSQLVIHATSNVHDIAIAGLFKTSMRFFNINPPGRLLNRFSQGNINLFYSAAAKSFLDLGKIDEFFTYTCEETMTILLEFIGTFCIAIWANWFSFGFNLSNTLI